MQPDRNPDRELRDLAPHVEYPPTPDLAGSVRASLEAEGGDATTPARTGSPLWWAAAAAILVLVALPVFATVLTTGGFTAGGAGSAGGGGREVVQQGAESGRTQLEGAASSAEGGEDMPTSGGGGDMPTSGGGPAGGSAAACASPSPSLEARPAQGAPGDGFEIRGRYFDGNLTDCDNDPARDVRIEFTQDGRTWDLGRFASDEESRLAAKLRVPADAEPGRATVRATYGQGPQGDPYGRQSAVARFYVTE